MKKVKKNQMKIIIFTPVKNRCMLHGHVFVMSHCFWLLLFHFLQRQGIQQLSFLSFFRIFEIASVCFVVASFYLVHDAEAISKLH